MKDKTDEKQIIEFIRNQTAQSNQNIRKPKSIGLS
jgi:hypothetical protein